MNLIMISAMYENGGNTTHRTLDGHPGLLVYPFESQVGTAQANDYTSSCVPVRYRWPEFPLSGSPSSDYERFWDEELKTLLRAPKRSKFNTCGLEMDEADRKAAFVAFLDDKPRTRQNIVLAYFHSTFAAWRNLRRTGKELSYLGYNPVQVLDAEKFFEDFPDGHMLHVVRNPFSGYADTKKRPFPLSLARYAWTWNQCQHAALVQRTRRPDRFHLLRFEDLATDPQSALTPILEAMGLPWCEACSYQSFNGNKLDQVYPWGTIRTPTTETNLATMAELGTDEIDEIKSLTSVMLALLDYEYLTKAAPSIAGNA